MDIDGRSQRHPINAMCSMFVPLTRAPHLFLKTFTGRFSVRLFRFIYQVTIGVAGKSAEVVRKRSFCKHQRFPAHSDYSMKHTAKCFKARLFRYHYRRGRLEAGRKNKNSEFGIQTNSHNPLYFNTEQEKVRILNSGNGFADR